ncbi:hypothetical protein FE840_005185 [Peteryoungia desertarenae]|uniref:Uncharacterized protein n=1 Tax=Peteryoungia desertarenae TaxID=1813451 RepID=A0ABX6QKA6_9HYPH|nr:hypothetical protein [Peteryoungia desertarenae]QLF68983.1 hypothetical protein FE840_005185 [Peteryoungia desertarenae]
MLSPVSTASNSSLNLQDMRSQAETNAGQTAAGQVNAAVARSGLDQNMTIAGRINMLLLSGPERMSQNLAILVEVLGRALKLDRQPEESLSAYAARLLAVMEGLDPQQRSNLQKLLYQSFAGLQLRTLLEAFRNPAGPEAATLSVYLELYRQKEKDLAARSVVGSYQQNDGDRPANDGTRTSARGAELQQDLTRGGRAVASTNANAATVSTNAAGVLPGRQGVQLAGAAGQPVAGVTSKVAAEIAVSRSVSSQSAVSPASPATDQPNRPAARPILSTAPTDAGISPALAKAAQDTKSPEMIGRIPVSGSDDRVGVARNAAGNGAGPIEDLHRKQLEIRSGNTESIRETGRTQPEGSLRSAASRGEALPVQSSFRQWSEAMRLQMPSGNAGGAEKGTNTLIASLMNMVGPGSAAEAKPVGQQGPTVITRDSVIEDAIRHEMAELLPEQDGETTTIAAKPGGFEEKVMVALTAQGQEAAQLRLPQPLPGQAMPFVTYLFVDDEPDNQSPEAEEERSREDDQGGSSRGDGENVADDGSEGAEEESQTAMTLSPVGELPKDTDRNSGLRDDFEEGYGRLSASAATDGAAGLYFRMIDWA